MASFLPEGGLKAPRAGRRSICSAGRRDRAPGRHNSGRARIEGTLSSTTAITLARMTTSSETSNALPAGVSASKMTSWSLERQREPEGLGDHPGSLARQDWGGVPQLAPAARYSRLVTSAAASEAFSEGGAGWAHCTADRRIPSRCSSACNKASCCFRTPCTHRSLPDRCKRPAFRCRNSRSRRCRR